MSKFTSEQYDAALLFLKTMDYTLSDAIQLLTLASAFGATLQSVNKEVENGSKTTG